MPARNTAADAASAGLAIVAALVSSLGGHLVRTDVALTGAVTGSGEIKLSAAICRFLLRT